LKGEDDNKNELFCISVFFHYTEFKCYSIRKVKYNDSTKSVILTPYKITRYCWQPLILIFADTSVAKNQQVKVMIKIHKRFQWLKLVWRKYFINLASCLLKNGLSATDLWTKFDCNTHHSILKHLARLQEPII
jgi:hypothetical protein